MWFGEKIRYVPTSLQIKAENPESDNQRLLMVLRSIFLETTAPFYYSIHKVTSQSQFPAAFCCKPCFMGCHISLHLGAEVNWKSLAIIWRFSQVLIWPGKASNISAMLPRTVGKCGQIATIYLQYITLKVRCDKSCYLFLLILS